MTTNPLPHADGIYGEVAANGTPRQPVIPTQRGASDRQIAPPKGGELKPILAPWMKDHAEFTYKMQDVSKRAAHTIGWHLWHVSVRNSRPVIGWAVLSGLWGRGLA
jgi:hypothetical protein